MDNSTSRILHLRLTVQGPVFIGSGQTIKKKEYYFDEKNGRVIFIDPYRFQKILVKYNKVDAYEQYMLNDSKRTLFDFCRDNQITLQLLEPAILWQTDAGRAIKGAGGQPAEIQTFMRDGNGNVYMPGSSIKGMLRTAILTKEVVEKAAKISYDKPQILQQYPDETSKRFAKRIENDAKRVKIEAKLFNTLGLNKRNETDAVNSIFRGVMIPDVPLPDAKMILCRKEDVNTKGQINSTLNLIRECLQPGTVIDVPIAIDSEFAKGIDKAQILKSVKIFDDKYNSDVLKHFETPENADPLVLDSQLFLGGGSGFNSKTITLPWLGEKDGVRYIADLLGAKFTNGKHHRDIELGVSPHTVKYTGVGAKLLPFGLCKVEIV